MYLWKIAVQIPNCKLQTSEQNIFHECNNVQHFVKVFLFSPLYLFVCIWVFALILIPNKFSSRKFLLYILLRQHNRNDMNWLWKPTTTFLHSSIDSVYMFIVTNPNSIDKRQPAYTHQRAKWKHQRTIKETETV